MGKRSQTIAASSGGSESNARDSGEAHHIGIFPQEDRGGTACEVGEDTCRKEEGGLGPMEPAVGMRQALVSEVRAR